MGKGVANGIGLAVLTAVVFAATVYAATLYIAA